MSKFLLIGSVAAVLYGDCAWGMDDIDPWRSASTSSQIGDRSERDSANAEVRSRRNSRTFHQDEQVQVNRARQNSKQTEENRFIKDNGYRQYHYVPSNTSKIGRATPTTIISVTDDLKCWNDIAEIRYANDVSYDKLENPKLILYRNRDNSCYIILRTDDGKKYGVFYGVNERNVEIGRQSFAVYEVSEDVGSFTDGVPRRIYVDESGLYFVSAAENSVEDVIKTYQSEGKFNFRGAVIKVSAIDGSITRNGEPITEDNFFDNWILEEREVGREVSKEKGRTVVKKVKETKTMLSTKQPNENEVLRNFYPPNGDYKGIYLYSKEYNVSRREMVVDWLNAYGKTTNGSTREILVGRNWLNSFINKRVSKEMSKQECEELVKNDTFALILLKYFPDDGSQTESYSYNQKVRDAIAAQLMTKGINYSDRERRPSASNMIGWNHELFKDPDFVRSLKPAFAELEKDYPKTKESDMWISFEIVRNL